MTATDTWRLDGLTTPSSPRQLGHGSIRPDLHVYDRPTGPTEAPVFAVMIHLLGAVALTVASLVLGAFVLLGVTERSAPTVLGVLLGLSGAAIWVAWLVRVTAATVRDEEDPLSVADETRRNGPAGACDLFAMAERGA